MPEIMTNHPSNNNNLSRMNSSNLSLPQYNNNHHHGHNNHGRGPTHSHSHGQHHHQHHHQHQQMNNNNRHNNNNNNNNFKNNNCGNNHNHSHHHQGNNNNNNRSSVSSTQTTTTMNNITVTSNSNSNSKSNSNHSSNSAIPLTQTQSTSGCQSSAYPDVVTTNSYYSPHSQFSQSMGSLSPLSINSNSYHSLPNQHKSSSNHLSPNSHNNDNNKINNNYHHHQHHNNNHNHHHHYHHYLGQSHQHKSLSLAPKHKCFHGYINYRKYHFSDKQSAKFSLQVFVAMHTTRQLAWYTQHEPWGDKNSLLFKYLDYTFRCAAFRDEVYTFEEKVYHFNKLNDNDDNIPSLIIPGDRDNDESDSDSKGTEGEKTNINPADMSDDERNGINRSESRLVFNTGLIARQSGRTIYLMLTPNQKKSVAQAWRVGYGDPYNRYNSSFVTDEWLLKNVIPSVENQRDLLPKQFILNQELFYQIKNKFQKNKLQIEADFDHIVTKYWDRIIGEYNKSMFDIFLSLTVFAPFCSIFNAYLRESNIYNLMMQIALRHSV